MYGCGRPIPLSTSLYCLRALFSICETTHNLTRPSTRLVSHHRRKSTPSLCRSWTTTSLAEGGIVEVPSEVPCRTKMYIGWSWQPSKRCNGDLRTPLLGQDGEHPEPGQSDVGEFRGWATSGRCTIAYGNVPPRRLPTIALGLDALGLEAPTTQLRIPSDVPPQHASPTTPFASMCLSPAPPTTPLSLALPRPDSNQEGAEFLGGTSERPDIGEMLDMLQDSGMGRYDERTSR